MAQRKELLIPALQKAGWECAHLRGISFYTSAFDVFRITKGEVVKEIVILQGTDKGLLFEQVFECTNLDKINKL